ncbi:hypothetical protein [Actinophytocola sp. NPDC049390]|uniref:hypothetical protein n=1 Tax=Actinophytocola sp. NPDC049390 TaxID=3363894 RepID=UPI0037AAF57D
MTARPLRDLLADLVGDAEARQAYGDDPAGYLAANGHPDLPSALVSEAVVAYADTAPVEVAEALAPYVAAHGPVPDPDARADWFDLLTAAEPVGADTFGEHLDTMPPSGEWSDPEELDFGAGAGPATGESTHEVIPDTDEVPVDDPAPEWPDDVVLRPEPPIPGLPATDDDEADDTTLE